MNEAEIRWVNDYHARVLAALSPYLEGEELDWLRNATLPLI